MTNQPWMLFHPEGTLAFYLWNGKHPILVNVHPSEGDPKDYVWGNAESKPAELTDEEIATLNKAASTPRKSVFVLNKRRYVIKQKGEFA